MNLKYDEVRKTMEIRKAKREDLKELLEIYNYEVLNGVATFDLNPKSME